MVTIGQTIREAREKQQLTPQEPDELCGVPASTIRRIESDSNDPAFGTVCTLCKALGLSLDALAGNQQEDAAPPAATSETIVAYRMHVNTLRHQLRVTTIILICLIAFLLGILIVDLLIPSAGWIRRMAEGIQTAARGWC